jgi:hypothetical protein
LSLSAGLGYQRNKRTLSLRTTIPRQRGAAMKAIGLSILSVFVFFVGWTAYQYYPLGMPVESPVLHTVRAAPDLLGTCCDGGRS